MRLIDGDALIEKFNEKVDMAECLIDARTAERFATFCALADAVEEMPTADVAPVVHGRWLCVDTDTEQFFLCNRCKKKEYWESNYCPNCGCRMDKEEE